MRLVQIAPSVMGGGGLADYARLVGLGLDGSGVEGGFLVVDQGDEARTASLGLPVVAMAGKSSQTLAYELAATSATTVLLHFVGYAYGNRGLCGWLVDGLARWKGGDAGRRLLVMFHELWAFGPPWRSSFWTNLSQRRIARQLARLADAWVTNTSVHAARLRSIAAVDRLAAVLPVFSNVGELALPTPLRDRAPVAVVFGQPPLRCRIHRQMSRFVPVLAAAGVERILDIGEPLKDGEKQASVLPVERRGFLSAGAASSVLATARLGLLTYPHASLAKSGVLAAYAAHGVVPVVDGTAAGAQDGLVHGETVVRLGAGTDGVLGLDFLARIAVGARRWYAAHDRSRTVECWRDLVLRQSGGHA